MNDITEPTEAGHNRLAKWHFCLHAVQTILSVAGLVVILLAVEQWREERWHNDFEVSQLITKGWHDHLGYFVEHPELRPYFVLGKPLEDADPLAEKVRALADIRLDLIDGMIAAKMMRGWGPDEGNGWSATFADAFRHSPVLCSEIRLSGGDYGKVMFDLGSVFI
jgi:hypothetical protein